MGYSFFFLIIFATSVFAAVSGESRFAALSHNAGMQGNPAALNAYESPGALFGYEKYSGKQLDNFLFGFFGNVHGAYFDWTKGENGYDESEWSYIFAQSNSSRLLFFGNRFSIRRTSFNEGSAFSWTPGFIFRPLSFFSFGFWSEQFLQYGPYQNRMQNAGLAIKPFNGITLGWNANIKDYERLKRFFSQTEQNLLLELEAFGLTMGLEFPLVEPDNTGEFRISLSAAVGSYFNTSVALAANNSNDMDFRKYNLMWHSALNKESLENTAMVRIPLGSIVEKNYGWSIFGGHSDDLQTLRNTFSLLESSTVKAVLFDFSNYSGSLSISQEIRRGIHSLRSKGKRIAAYTDNYRASIIYAASAAEKIILQPSAFVDFKGFSGEVMYYKGLLDWAGVRVEMLRRGKYKSAVEPYTLDSMSKEARENLYEILDGWWRMVRDSLAYSRKLPSEFLDSIANNPQVTATAAKNNGIADTLLYLEEVPKYMVKSFWGKEKEDAWLEDWYLSGEKILSNSWASRKKIAVMNIDGVISGGYGSGDPLFGKSVSGVMDLIELINNTMYSGEYEALILRINSPGGSAVASDELWHSLNKLREYGVPIIASVGDMAASGAYYAACAADMIVAEHGSIVGSIGIYGGKVDLSGLLAKLKIRAETVKTHESANSSSFSTGFSESERNALQEYMDEFYSRFVSVVAQGRGISEEHADSLGGGQVFTGAVAKRNGLVDEIGGFERAVEIAKEHASLGKNQRVELVHINNYGYSFADRISAMAKGEKPLYPWIKSLEKTQMWAVFIQ